MALFNRKSDSKKQEAAQANRTGASSAQTERAGARASSAHILRHARITEKATMHASENVYVFDVSPSATKRDIVMAVRDIYSVVPRMVRVANIPTKTTRNPRTGVMGLKRGGKKAYVYLKKGETIIIS